MGTESDDIRGAIERHLETDLLLGVRSTPLRPPTPKAATRPAGRQPTAAPRPTAAQPPAPGGPVIRSQQISDAEKAEREKALQELDTSRVKACTRCGLHATRTNTVFGQGNAAARLVFVGEAPGADEDAQGVAFIGRAGQLLGKMIAAMGLTREEVFICNILKCRPPNNRDPAPDEISSCWPYLDQQLQIIRPEVIVALGKPASQTLLRTKESIGRLRGQWHDYYTSGMEAVGDATPLMPTYHPAYLLRSPGEKGKAWSDLKMVMAKLALPVPQS